VKTDFAVADLGLKGDGDPYADSCSGELCEGCRRLALYKVELCVGRLVCDSGLRCKVSGLTPSEGGSVSLGRFILD